MSWQLIAIIAPLSFVIYQVLAKLLPKDLSPFLINAYASAIGVFFMLILYWISSENKSLALSPKYLPLAIGIGILISLGNAAIIKAYALGAPQSSFSAIYYPALIIYALLVGLLFWHEKINFYQGIGFALSLIGMFFITYFK